MLFLSLLLIFAAKSAVAWDDHHLINRAALDGIVTGSGHYVPLEKALPEGETPDDFRRRLKINRGWEFEKLLGETEGGSVAWLDVIAKYGDEPDG